MTRPSSLLNSKGADLEIATASDAFAFLINPRNSHASLLRRESIILQLCACQMQTTFSSIRTQLRRSGEGIVMGLQDVVAGSEDPAMVETMGYH